MAEGSHETDWRQGHFLAANDLQHLFPEEAKQGYSVAVVITHDCDIARPHEVEPYVEILLGRLVGSLDGNYTHAKNSRRLHLGISTSAEEAFIEFTSNDKARLEKSNFLALERHQELALNADQQRTLQAWLAARYRRAAFPTEFNNRLESKGVTKKISKKLAPMGTSVTAVYFDLEPNEEILDSTSNYELSIYVLWDDEGYDEKHTQITKLISDLSALFDDAFYDRSTNRWSQVELTECTDVSEQAMTYALFSRLQRWDADHVSLRATPQQRIPE